MNRPVRLELARRLYDATGLLYIYGIITKAESDKAHKRLERAFADCFGPTRSTPAPAEPSTAPGTGEPLGNEGGEGE